MYSAVGNFVSLGIWGLLNEWSSVGQGRSRKLDEGKYMAVQNPDLTNKNGKQTVLSLAADDRPPLEAYECSFAFLLFVSWKPTFLSLTTCWARTLRRIWHHGKDIIDVL